MDAEPDNQLPSMLATKAAEHTVVIPAQHFAKQSAAYCAAFESLF